MEINTRPRVMVVTALNSRKSSLEFLPPLLWRARKGSLPFVVNCPMSDLEIESGLQSVTHCIDNSETGILLGVSLDQAPWSDDG